MSAVLNITRVIALALLGFFLTATLVTPVEAGSTHYQYADWASNPTLYGDSTMPAPFSATATENLVFYADDPWDNVTAAWVNIAVIDTLPLGENITVGSVPVGRIYVTAYAGGVGGPYGTTAKLYGGALLQDINRAAIRMNKNVTHWSLLDQTKTSTAGVPNKMDYLTVLIHEYGHAMGITHSNGTFSGGAAGGNYGFCSDTGTSSTTNWANQETMCRTGIVWKGSTTQGGWGRTLHPHEVTDYGANY